MPRTDPFLRALALLLLAAAVSGSGRVQAQAQAQAFERRLVLDPAAPRAGETLRVRAYIEGLSPEGLELARLELDGGLRLESQSIRAYVDPATGMRQSLLELVLDVLEPGGRSIASILVRGREGSFELGPLVFRAAAGEGGAAAATAADAAFAWRWAVPSAVRRFEAFELRLERADGSPAPKDAAASFPPPAGASIEPSGPLAWTAIALEEGLLALPEAYLSTGSAAPSRAPRASIPVRPLPSDLSSSRALGDFTLRLEGPAEGEASEGRSLVLRLVLEGRGNHPALRLPEPSVSLEGRALPEGATAERRIDESRAVDGCYAGRTILELLVTPPVAGRLRIEVPPLAVLRPEGSLVALRVAFLELTVRPAVPGSRDGAGPLMLESKARAEAFGPDLEASARRLAARGAFSSLPALIASWRAFEKGSAKRAQAATSIRETLRDGSSATRDAPAEADFIEAALRWDSGELGSALALLYGILRRYPGLPGLAATADYCGRSLGAAPPLLDELPPPRLFVLGAAAAFAAAAFAATAAGAGRSFLRRRGADSGRGKSTGSPPRRASAPRLVPAIGACILLLLSLVSLGLAGIAKAERAMPYALLWTDRLAAVPSRLAENTVSVTRGTTARIRTFVEGEGKGNWAGLLLADGLAGWVPLESIYEY